jgi:hypothetical protein
MDSRQHGRHDAIEPVRNGAGVALAADDPKVNAATQQIERGAKQIPGEKHAGPRSSWVGLILMAASFGIYFAYPVVPFLPLSMWQKGGVVIGLAAVSWGVFLAGSALVGRKGVAPLEHR